MTKVYTVMFSLYHVVHGSTWLRSLATRFFFENFYCNNNTHSIVPRLSILSDENKARMADLQAYPKRFHGAALELH